MAAFKDSTVALEFTISRDYVISDTASAVAKMLGISVAELRRTVIDGEELDDVTKLGKLVDAATVESEEFDLTESEQTD